MLLAARNNGRSARFAICYLFVALCLSDVALVNAQTQVPPPPALGTRGRPTPVVVQPPPDLGTRNAPVGRPGFPRKPTPPPKEPSVWFNVAWITAITALIAAIATLIGSLRKKG